MSQSIESIRDEIAGLLGWKKRPDGSRWWDCETTSCNCHPVPATLDGIAATMPEGWGWYSIGWQIENVEARAIHHGTYRTARAEGLGELEARTRLLLAVLKAGGGK